MKHMFLFLGVFLMHALNLRADQIAFFYALDSDGQAFKKAAAKTLTSIQAGQTVIHAGQIGPHSVHAVKMGSGCVQTAINAQALLGRTPVDLIISTGLVGSLDDKLPAGSWVCITSVQPYQAGTWGTSGFHAAAALPLPFPNWPPRSLLPEPWKSAPEITVASGEVFINSNSKRLELASSQHAQAVDMNLFGLVSCTKPLGSPQIAFRIVSDFANNNAGEDFKKFAKTYQGQGWSLAEKTILSLPKNPNRPESYENLQKIIHPESSSSAPTPPANASDSTAPSKKSKP